MNEGSRVRVVISPHHHIELLGYSVSCTSCSLLPTCIKQATCLQQMTTLTVQTGTDLFLGTLQGHKASGQSGARLSRDQTATASSSGRALPAQSQQGSSYQQQQQKKPKNKKRRGRRH